MLTKERQTLTVSAQDDLVPFTDETAYEGNASTRMTESPVHWCNEVFTHFRIFSFSHLLIFSFSHFLIFAFMHLGADDDIIAFGAKGSSDAFHLLTGNLSQMLLGGLTVYDVDHDLFGMQLIDCMVPSR